MIGALRSRRRNVARSWQSALLLGLASVALTGLLGVGRSSTAHAAAYVDPDRPCIVRSKGQCRVDPGNGNGITVGLPAGTVIAGTSGVVVSVQVPVPVVLSGFLPGSLVTLTAYSKPIPIGTYTADANGQIRASINLPKELPAGNHHLVAEGESTIGKPVAKALAFEFAPPAAVSIPDQESPAGALPALFGFLFVFGAAGAVAAQRRLRGVPEVATP